MAQLESRVEALETALAYQEQTIEDLNAALNLQAREIETLKRDLARLGAHLRDVAAHPALTPEQEPPPPHY
jgi:SlyX protein